ncbi:protein of unknown function [Flagellimonas taeanensis]|uniref:DUF4956 domain-containing protein n=1 Tax=Flagellimonas taeanensis TaxID=1005926 RepID=A0A1M6QDH6_9FLAO|nr:DUF4956 domain-containing protein [Allomuricauda taeanensis]SFB70308.1 protein of unknown function [Allomuricauda taeanensis]SHK18225.1 protein of unknown function [Allomuricauda taeanensis]
MTDLINQFDLGAGDAFSLTNYILNIVLSILLLFLLSVVYVKYGRSLSNRSHLSKVLVLVGVTTFIIISIVKSSLALSLGLVGALSIIRFRTAIKEPEELGYFFIAIAIGLGFGANQPFPTVIGMAFLFLVVVLSNRKKVAQDLGQNLIISLSDPDSTLDLKGLQSRILDIVTQNSSRTELVRLNISESNLDCNFLIVLSDYQSVNNITESLLGLNKNISMTFIDSQNMTI